MTSDLRRLAGVVVAGLLGTTSPVLAADPKEEARVHFVAGLDAAQRRDFRLAVGQFLASYESYPHPTTARNVAKAYEDLGDLVRARLWYRRFQEIAPHLASEVAGDLLRVEERLDPVPASPSVRPADATAEVEKPDMADVLERLGPAPAPPGRR